MLAVLALLLAGTFLLLSIDQVRNNPTGQGKQAMLTLCAWQDSLRAQVDADWQFLQENPEGTEGISEESVARDIENTRVVLDILSPYLKNCEEVREG